MPPDPAPAPSSRKDPTANLGFEAAALEKAHRSMPPSLTYLTRCEGTLTSEGGDIIEVWELRGPVSSAHLSKWAQHFRQHYCPDSEIDELRAGTSFSRADYLVNLVFPDATTAPGPSIRSGDFAEILISDYVEHVLRYWVPRGKYAEKASRNESVKGVDILGFKMLAHTHAPADELLAFEVKAELSGGAYSGALQKAVTDSAQDYLRSAFTLNATKRRLKHAGAHERALVVERFQNKDDRPFVFKCGAGAVLSDLAYDEAGVCNISTESHQNGANLQLLVVKGTDLMALVRSLFQTAANEA